MDADCETEDSIDLMGWPNLATFEMWKWLVARRVNADVLAEVRQAALDSDINRMRAIVLDSAFRLGLGTLIAMTAEVDWRSIAEELRYPDFKAVHYGNVR
jgi:hypothetical protein